MFRQPLEINQEVGAREPEVEEPQQDLLFTSEASLFRSDTIIQIEFDQVPEPKALTGIYLQFLSQIYGTSEKVAEAIGASEAFVRQNLRNSGKTVKTRVRLNKK